MMFERPIGSIYSLYGIYTNICLICLANVDNYTKNVDTVTILKHVDNYTKTCAGGLNSHWFPVVGDSHFSPIVGVYIPIVRIPY